MSGSTQEISGLLQECPLGRAPLPAASAGPGPSAACRPRSAEWCRATCLWMPGSSSNACRQHRHRTPSPPPGHRAAAGTSLALTNREKAWNRKRPRYRGYSAAPGPAPGPDPPSCGRPRAASCPPRPPRRCPAASPARAAPPRPAPSPPLRREAPAPLRSAPPSPPCPGSAGAPQGSGREAPGPPRKRRGRGRGSSAPARPARGVSARRFPQVRGAPPAPQRFPPPLTAPQRSSSPLAAPRRPSPPLPAMSRRRHSDDSDGEPRVPPGGPAERGDWAGEGSGGAPAAPVTLRSVCRWSRAAPQETEDVRAVGDRGEAGVAHLQGGREGRRAGPRRVKALFPSRAWRGTAPSAGATLKRKYLFYEMDGKLPVFCEATCCGGQELKW